VKASVSAAAMVTMVIALTPASASAKSCDNSNDPDHPWGELKAHNTSCSRAKSVANAYSPGSSRAAGFTCHVSQTGIEGAPVSCHKGSKRVSFRLGF
jgi:hypothetical protein